MKPAATESGWHEWELEWKPEGIKIYIDSYQIFEYKRTPEMTRREWPYVRRADLSKTDSRGDAAAATWKFSGDELRALGTTLRFSS